MKDSFGLNLQTEEAKCVAAINSYFDAVLAYKPFSAWVVAEEAVSEDPKCAMARVLAADYAFCRGDAACAKEHLNSVNAQDGERSWRENRYVEAWNSWVVKGDPKGTHSILLDVLSQCPHDLFAVKRAQIMGLILGDGALILSPVEAAVASAPTSPPPRYLHGMWVFGLEQGKEYAKAEATARDGLAFEKDLGCDAWLDHGLAHALYFQGEDRLDEALEFLESKSSTWNKDALHPFLYTHNWWHLALLYCEKRDFDAAIKVFDERLWEDDVEMRKDPQVQLNALGLLWRLETRGQQGLAGSRWRSVLASAVGSTMPDEDGKPGPCMHGDLLLDVCLIRALSVEASPKLEEFLNLIASHSSSCGERAEAYVSIARNVAELYRTDMPEKQEVKRRSEAQKALRSMQKNWHFVGGSEEQRGVLLEAVEGPIVCGEPEQNYDELFL